LLIPPPSLAGKVPDTFVFFPQEIAPGPYVTLSFADTGCGMDEATRSRIFEPFFTTKDVGQGTGLGLATVYGIVQQNGGCIDVASEPGRGSRFTLLLPPTAEPLPAEEPKVEPAPLPQGTETILLVEDDDGVRTLAWQVLEDCGYTVLDARHGQEALAVSQEFPDEIHLILTDLTMPEITGPELVRRLRPGRPAIKVLYMSGHADSARAVAEPLRLLAKPFAAEELARKVRETLGIE
jgi:CheY-like chemotaxis protein